MWNRQQVKEQAKQIKREVVLRLRQNIWKKYNDV